MRKKVFFIISCALFMFNGVRAQLTIDSVSFVVQTGAVVTVTGDISSAKGLPGFGKFLLQGTDSQSVNMNGNTIPKLEIDNSLGVWLFGNMRVSQSLTFTNGKFIAGNHNFSLADIASISGMGNSKFIETTGTGQVFKEISSNLTSNEIPVGAGTIYRPAFLTTTGSNSGGKVGVQVLGGPSANKPPSTSDYLKTNWTITKTGVSGTLTVNANYSDPTDISGTESNLKGYLFNGTNWASSGSINTSTNMLTFTISIPSANITAIDKFDLLNAKVFLQGAYIYPGTSYPMSDNLRTAGLIPLTDPYRVSPYSGNFTEVNDAITETVPASVFSDQSSQNDNIVDWVFLELRNTAGTTVLQTRSALVERDGDIVDVDGKSPVTFNNVDPGSYTIVVRHRNHLGIRSSITIDFSSGSGTYDFTTASTQVYQNQSYTSTVQMGSIWAMRAGNANSNNNVKYNGPANDQNQILNIKLAGSLSNILNNIYSPEDINMNGNVKWNGPGNDQNFLLNTILNGSLSTIYLEQL